MDTPKKTLFHIHLPPNILLVGFDLEEREIIDDDDRWWFTLSENPSEPRFGLDESRDKPVPPGGPSRDDLIWDDFAVAEGGFLERRPAADLRRDLDSRRRWPGGARRVPTSPTCCSSSRPAPPSGRRNMLTGSRQP